LIEKSLNFRRRAVPEMIAAVVYAGLALILLRAGYGVWSVIVARVVQSGVLTASLYVAAPLRPRLLSRVNGEVLRTLFHYGRYLGAMAIVGFGVFNFDNVAVGGLVGAEALGAYALAYTVTNLVPTFLTQTLTKVFFPVYASIRDDYDRLRAAHEGALHYLAMIMLPTTAALILMVPGVLVVLFGDEWRPAEPLVRILAIFGVARTLGAIAGALLSAVGRPDLALRSTVTALVVPMVLLWPLSRFGASGIAVAFSAGQVAAAAYSLGKGRAYWPRSPIRLFAPAALATAAALLGVLAMPSTLPPRMASLGELGLFSGVYVAVLLMFDNRVREFTTGLLRRSVRAARA
jgi:O-antigen/teichoic acid export membrane protein